MRGRIFVCDSGGLISPIHICQSNFEVLVRELNYIGKQACLLEILSPCLLLVSIVVPLQMYYILKNKRKLLQTANQREECKSTVNSPFDTVCHSLLMPACIFIVFTKSLGGFQISRSLMWRRSKKAT